MSDTYDGEDYTRIEITAADRHLFEVGDTSDALAHKVLEFVQKNAKGFSKGMQFEVEFPADLFKSVSGLALAMSVDQFAPHYGLEYKGHVFSGVVRFEFEQRKG